MKCENYIFSYYQQIKEESVVVGKYIKQVYEKIIEDLKNKVYFYDAKKANRAITYIENFCHHHEGELAPQLIKLELWQKAFIASVFGLVDAEGKRQFNEVLLVIGRKNGKTLLASGIASYMLYADGEYGARVYFTAPKLQQASLCYDAMYQSILKEEDLIGITKKRKTDLYVSVTNSSASPLASSARKSDGLNIFFSCCDELGAWQGENGLKFYEVIRSSFGARKQPLLLGITTSTYINNGIYDEMISRCTRYLNGDSEETKLLPMLYMIDDINQWNDITELQKSNPNMNVSISVDYLLEEIAIAETSLSKKSEFLVKHCNVKATSSVSWLRANVVNDMFTKSPLDLNSFRKSYCVMGLDLSQTTDLTSLSIVIEKDEKLHVFNHFWLPSARLEKAIERDGLPYELYIKQGWLSLSGESYIDYRDVEAYIYKMMREYQIIPLMIGYDRYSSTYLINDLKGNGFQNSVDDVYQGDNLWGVIQEAESLFTDKKVICSQNDLLKIHLMDSAIKMNHERGKGRLVKIHQTAHIDGTASLLCALCVRQKYWASMGNQLQNIKRDY